MEYMKVAEFTSDLRTVQHRLVRQKVIVYIIDTDNRPVYSRDRRLKCSSELPGVAYSISVGFFDIASSSMMFDPQLHAKMD